MRERPFQVRSPHGGLVHGTLRLPADDAPAPVVLFCHGFKGFVDWGAWPVWGRRLAADGFAAVHLNFSHNGVTPGAPTTFARLDLFERNRFTYELEDLAAVLDAVAGRFGETLPLDPTRVGLVGHSRGGGIAVLQAARDPRIGALATWNAVSGLAERFTAAQIHDWETQGYTAMLNSRTGQLMRLDRVLYDDARAHAALLDVRAAAARVRQPWLVVHAEDDETVPFSEGEALHAAGGRARLFRAAGGHTFGARHPLDGPLPPTVTTVFDETLAFFRRHLRG